MAWKKNPGRDAKSTYLHSGFKILLEKKNKILKEIANLAFFMKLTYKKSPPRDMV